MVASMTNEQLAILLNDIQKQLDNGIDSAENAIAEQYPNIKGWLGNPKTTVLAELKQLNNELRLKINSLTPTRI